MDASLVIRLIDQATGPANRIAAGLKKIRAAGRDMAGGFSDAIRRGFSVENVDQALSNAEQRLGRARQRLTGALATGLALAAPLKGMMDFEDRMVGFGNVAGIFGDDLKKIEAQLRATGPQVNKSATEMLDALEYLVGKGMSPEQGLAAIRSIGMTSTATGAQITDMSASGYAAMDNLKVAATDLQLAFDAMAQAGKAGGFELDSMAQYFPSLTAKAQALGMQGVDAVAELAAALQVARKGAGDDASTANNMQNFLSKLSSPETVRNFKKMGIDIRKEFDKAGNEGTSVFEHMLGVIEKATGGDQIKMGNLFGDMQVLDFLRPMMANMEEFRRIRDEAMKASGVNEADFARVMVTGTARAKALAVELSNLVAQGSPLLDVFKEVTDRLIALVSAANAFASANPELTRQLVLGAAGLMAFSIAARVAAFAFSGLRLGMVNLASLFLRFNDTGRNVAPGWRLLAGAGRTLAMAFGLVKAALVGLAGIFAGLSWPVLALIAVLAAAGVALWKYWDTVSSFLSGFAAPFASAFGTAIGWIGQMIGKLGELLGIDFAGLAAAIANAFDFSGLLDGAKAAVSGIVDWFRSFFSAEQLTAGQKEAMYASGQAMGQALIDGIKAIVTAGIEALKSLLRFAVEIEWPEPPAWLSWLIERGRSAVSGATEAVSGSQTPTPAAAGSASGMPAVQSMLAGMDGMAAGARSDLEQGGQAGGQAVAAGGKQGGDAILAAALQAAAALNGAAAKLSNIKVNVTATGAGGSVGGAIKDAKAGALHGGTE